MTEDQIFKLCRAHYSLLDTIPNVSVTEESWGWDPGVATFPF